MVWTAAERPSGKIVLAAASPAAAAAEALRSALRVRFGMSNPVIEGVEAVRAKM
jgi:hypothetical protein